MTLSVPNHLAQTQTPRQRVVLEKAQTPRQRVVLEMAQKVPKKLRGQDLERDPRVTEKAEKAKRDPRVTKKAKRDQKGQNPAATATEMTEKSIKRKTLGKS